MKNKISALVLAFAMLLALCACGAEPAPAGSETVTDMVGRQVSVEPGSYKRVVCIGAGALRLYSYVGDMSLLCGVEDIDNLTLTDRPRMFDGVARPYVLAYEDVFAALPSCGVGGPNAQAAEAEKILSCEPDIVISLYADVEKADALQAQLGVPVITLRTGADSVFDEAFFASLRLLGKIFAAETRAEELIGYITAQKEEIARRTENISEADKPAAYICGLGNWGTTDHLSTSQSYVSFRVANVRNAVGGLASDGVVSLEEEKFAALGESMDVMFIDTAAIKNILPLYAGDSTLLDTCKAWREGRVYLEMAYNAYYTNYEIALMNTWFIASAVYPKAFSDVDMTQKADEITEAFLGRALTAEIFACPDSFGGYSADVKKIFQ